MSRKIILSLAVVATLAGAALMSSNADAMMRNGGHSNFRAVGPVNHVGRVGRIDHRIGHWRIHEHRHFVRWHNHISIRPVGYVEGVTTVQPGPCTCLTKNYTQEGLVVFQDLCTKEMASAPVDGSDQAQAEQGPVSYAGEDLSGLPEGQPAGRAGRDQEELGRLREPMGRPAKARAAFVPAAKSSARPLLPLKSPANI